MREVRGNLFDYRADAVCITTNRSIKKDGTAVMGVGVAKLAAERYRWLPLALGNRLQVSKPNSLVFVFDPDEYTARDLWKIGEDEPSPKIVTWAVKDDWREMASETMIVQGLWEIGVLADALGWERIALPRPGCGAGGRRWRDVKQLIEPILDDRFVVVDLAG